MEQELVDQFVQPANQPTISCIIGVSNIQEIWNCIKCHKRNTAFFCYKMLHFLFSHFLQQLYRILQNSMNQIHIFTKFNKQYNKYKMFTELHNLFTQFYRILTNQNTRFMQHFTKIMFFHAVLHMQPWQLEETQKIRKHDWNTNITTYTTWFNEYQTVKL